MEGGLFTRIHDSLRLSVSESLLVFSVPMSLAGSEPSFPTGNIGQEAACRHSARAMNAALGLLAALNCFVVMAMN